MTDPVQPDSIDPQVAAAGQPDQIKNVELPKETLATLRRELLKVLGQLKTPRKPTVLVGKLRLAIDSLPENQRPNLQGVKMSELLDAGFLADADEGLLWDEAKGVYSVAATPALPSTPQLPATPSSVPLATKELTIEGWKSIDEIPTSEREAIAAEIFRIMLRTRHLQQSDFTGKKLRQFLDALPDAARKKFSPALIGFAGEPGTFGQFFIAGGLANPIDPNNINSQIELRSEVVDVPSPSYARALEILEGAETSGNKPLRPSHRALQYEALHPARAAAWQRLMASTARVLRPDPLQLGAALGLTPTLTSEGKRRFTDAEYDTIAAFRRELLNDGLLREVSSAPQKGKGKGVSRVEFAIEPHKKLSYAMALTEMLWRRNTNTPYETIASVTSDEAQERLTKAAKGLEPHIQRFTSAIEGLEKASAAGGVPTDAERAEALAARDALRAAYIPVEQLWESIADRGLRTTLEKSIVAPVRDTCLDLDARYNVSTGAQNSDAATSGAGAEAPLNEFIGRMQQFVKAAEPTLAKYEAVAAQYVAAQASGDLAKQKSLREEGRRLDIDLQELADRIRQSKKSLPAISDRMTVEKQVLDPLVARIEAAYAAFGKPAGPGPVAAPKKATIDEIVSIPAAAFTPGRNQTRGFETTPTQATFNLGGRMQAETRISQAEALAQFEQGETTGVSNYAKALDENNPKRNALLGAVHRYESVVEQLSKPEMVAPSAELDSNIAMLEERKELINQRIKRSVAYLNAMTDPDRDFVAVLSRMKHKSLIERIPLIGRLFEPPYVKRARRIIEQKTKSSVADPIPALDWVIRHETKADNRLTAALSEKLAIEKNLRMLQEIKARAVANAPERERLFAALREEHRRISFLLKP